MKSFQSWEIKEIEREIFADSDVDYEGEGRRTLNRKYLNARLALGKSI